MMIYRRWPSAMVWHFMQYCSNWPVKEFVTERLPSGQIPTQGTLCEECVKLQNRKLSEVKP
jgi:hypothetical protein